MNEWISFGNSVYQGNKDYVLMALPILWAIWRFLGASIKTVAAKVGTGLKWCFTIVPKPLDLEASEMRDNMGKAVLQQDKGLLVYNQVIYCPDGSVKIRRAKFGNTAVTYEDCPVHLESHEKTAMKEAFKLRLAQENARLKEEFREEAASPTDKKWMNRGNPFGLPLLANIDAKGQVSYGGMEPNGAKKKA